MTEDEIDAMIAPLYARGQIARDTAWRAFEATLAEIRANLVSQARFVQNFGHLASNAMTAAEAAETTLRHSMPSPEPLRHSMPSPDDEADEAFERRLAWMRETARGGE